jgi:hypothetical protein
MRKHLIVYVALSLAPTAVPAQVSPAVRAQLQSPEWTERQTAFESLAGSHGELANQSLSPDVRNLLISLLRVENEVVRAAFLEGTGASDKYGEGYSEYTAWLADAVARIAEREPDRSDVWPALLASGYDPESAFSRWLATHGDKAAPFLLETARGHDLYFRREDALMVLAQIVAYERQPSNSHHLTPSKVAEIESAIRAGLDDKEDGWLVRYQAVKALALIGTKEDIDLLERIATLDTEFVTNGGQSGTELRYPIREIARASLLKLRQRLGVTQ